MNIVDNGIYERMMPTDVVKGPVEIFNVRLEHLFDDELINAIEEMRSHGVYCQLGEYSDRVGMALHGKISAPQDNDEMGVMTRDDMPCYPDASKGVVVRQITANDDSFAAWCKFGENCEHHWIFYPQYHFHLVEEGKLFCFLAYVDDRPVARAAIIVGDGTAALDFIDILPGYHGKGIDSALCQYAIKYAFDVIGVNHLASYGFKAEGYRYPLFKELGFPIINADDK